MRALEFGRDVVIDSTASYEAFRQYLFCTSGPTWNIPAEKHLLSIHADPDVLQKRNLARGRTNDVIADWNFYEDPQKIPGVQFHTYENSIDGAIDGILETVSQKFDR